MLESIVTAQEMKQYDYATIHEIGIPSAVLMERAALSVADRIRQVIPDHEEAVTVLVAAGIGNNGGDGLAIARLLAEQGHHVEVWIVGDAGKGSADFSGQLSILKHYSVIFCDKPGSGEYTIIVDALFGVGLSREVTGPYLEAVETINSLKGYVIAVDLPSGIDSDKGQVLGAAVRADETVTFEYRKRGLVFFPGASYAGRVTVAGIGIRPVGESGLFAYTGSCRDWMPARAADGNKGTFGKVLLVAGSPNMAGAAILSAQAAYRTGGGMVKVISSEENRIPIHVSVPEALFGTAENLMESLDWADVIAIGSGLGQSRWAFRMLTAVIDYGKKKLLLDADALNLLAENDTLKEALTCQAKAGRGIVITPHPGELSRWTGKSVKELKKDLCQAARVCSAALGGVVVAKDARTVVSCAGPRDYVNLSGNSGLATAGSGDVLTGIIAALMAQESDLFRAACTGCYLHGKAAEKAALELGERSLIPGDIPKALQEDEW
ncbi:MAG: NAD(P)H-hydrate dehydratase [Acetatifactor sp.]